MHQSGIFAIYSKQIMLGSNLSAMFYKVLEYFINLSTRSIKYAEYIMLSCVHCFLHFFIYTYIYIYIFGGIYRTECAAIPQQPRKNLSIPYGGSRVVRPTCRESQSSHPVEHSGIMYGNGTPK